MAKRRRVEKEKEVGVEMEVEEDRLKGMPSRRPTPEGNAQIHPKEMGMRSSKQPNKRRRAETEMGVEVEVKEDRLGKKSTKHPRKRKNLEREGEVQQKDLEVVEDSRYLYPREFRKTTVHVSNYSSLHTLRDVHDSIADATKKMINSVQLMMDGFSEKMAQSFNSLGQRIESVESMVPHLLKTIGAPLENHTVVGFESDRCSKDGYNRNDESNIEDCGLGPTCKDGDSRNDESNVENSGLESIGPSKEGDSRNDESKEDEAIDEILTVTDKVEEADGRPIDMNHTDDCFEDIALNEKNDSDGVKADVQGPGPDTDHIRQDEPEVMLKDKGENIDVEIQKEDMLKNKVSSEEEDADTDTSHIRRGDPAEELMKDKDLSVEETADAHNLKETGLSEEEGTDTGVVMDSIPEKVSQDLGPPSNKVDETMDEILSDKVEEEDGRPIVMHHAGDSFDDSALNEKNDSDVVKADVQGPRPDTSEIRQDEPIEVIQEDKGEDTDVEIEKEDMLKNKVSSEDEDAVTDTSHNCRDDAVEDKGLSEKEDVDMEEMLADTGLSEEEAADTGVVMDSIPEKVREDHTGESGESSVDHNGHVIVTADVEEEDGDPVVESTKLVEKHAVQNPGTETGQNYQDSYVEEDGDAEAESDKSNEEHGVSDSLVDGAINTKCTLDGVKPSVDDKVLSRKVESSEQDRGLGPTSNIILDGPVDKVVEEEDDDARINMTSEATEVRESRVVDSGLDEKNDFDGVKADVQGTDPDTNHIPQYDVVELLDEMMDMMRSIGGWETDAEIANENMLRDKVLSVEEDGDAVVESPKLVEKHAVEIPATETGQNYQDSNVEEDGDAEAESDKSNEEHGVSDSLVDGAINTKCALDGVKPAVDDKVLSRKVEFSEEDRGLGPISNIILDGPVDKFVEEEDVDARINLTSEATEVRESRVVDSGLDEKNDFDGVKADVQGTDPDTNHIPQDDVVKVMLTNKGEDTDKENILTHTVLSVEEDADEETARNRQYKKIELEGESDDSMVITATTLQTQSDNPQTYRLVRIGPNGDMTDVSTEMLDAILRDINEVEGTSEHGTAEMENPEPISRAQTQLNLGSDPVTFSPGLDNTPLPVGELVKEVVNEQSQPGIIHQSCLRSRKAEKQHLEKYESHFKKSKGVVIEETMAVVPEEEVIVAAVPEVEETMDADAEEDDRTMIKDVKGSRIIEKLDSDKKQKVLEYFSTHHRTDIAWIEYKNNAKTMFDISGELILQLTSEEAFLDSKFIDFYISRLRTKMNSNPKYGKAIFLSPKAYESFVNGKAEFKDFWIKNIVKDYHECKPLKLFAPMSNNNNHFSLLEYDLVGGASWCHRNSLSSMKTKKEYSSQAKSYASAISKSLYCKIPLALNDTALSINSPKQASYPECLLFVCYYMKCGMKNTGFETESFRLKTKKHKETVRKVSLMRASMLYKIISDADSWAY